MLACCLCTAPAQPFCLENGEWWYWYWSLSQCSEQGWGWNVPCILICSLNVQASLRMLLTASQEWMDCVGFLWLWSLLKLEAGQVYRVYSGRKCKLHFLLGRWAWGICSFSAWKCMTFCLISWEWEGLEYVGIIPHFVICYLHTVCTLLFSVLVPAPWYYCNLFLWSWCWSSCKNN